MKPGEPFGKYVLVDGLGFGTMGETWRGAAFGPSGFDRVIALKKIRTEEAELSPLIAALAEDFEVVVRLKHENIAQLIDAGHLANTYFIASEYVSGKDLHAVAHHARKNGKRLPIPLVCFLISECARGLEYAHRSTVVHRDVAPSNVVLGFEGEVKLVDWLNWAMGRIELTGSVPIRGKFALLSPEQAQGKRLDARSDLFQPGLCLYELLTGVKPFAADSDLQILRNVVACVVEPPTSHDPMIPSALEAIVLRALQKDPAARFQSSAELQHALLAQTTARRAELAGFMQATFSDDFATERAALAEYRGLRSPDVQPPPPPDPRTSELIQQLADKWGA